MNRLPRSFVDEAAARQLLLLRAFEAEPDSPLWTVDDRAWASRLAREGLAPGATPERFVLERTRHALQRLRARDGTVERWLDARFALGRWLALAAVVGLLAGLAVDQIGPSQRINLLAPPIWLLVLWNVAVLLGLALQSLLPAPASGVRRGGRLRRALQAWWKPALQGSAAVQQAASDWLARSTALNGARAALLLHVAAALLALGVVGGLYLRGLVLDYQAGWQSSFLEPATVRATLATLLAPASTLTGITVPPTEVMATLRVGADGLAPGGQAPAAGQAAPWLHLYAATLLLFVIVPRLLLAALAAAQVRWRSRRWPLPWHEPYFQGLLRLAADRPGRVWLLPHAAPLAAPTALSLQALLQTALGGEPGHAVQLQVADPVGHGNETDASRCSVPADATLLLLLVDLANTPEAEAQGRLLATLSAQAEGRPLLLLVDETAFASRFAALPQRLQQRRQAWQQWADN